MKQSYWQNYWTLFSVSVFDGAVIKPVHPYVFSVAVVLLTLVCIGAIQGHITKALLCTTQALELTLVIEIYAYCGAFGNAYVNTVLFAVVFSRGFLYRQKLIKFNMSLKCIYIIAALVLAWMFSMPWLCMYVLTLLGERRRQTTLMRPWVDMLVYYIPRTAYVLVSLVVLFKGLLFKWFITTTSTTSLEVSLLVIKMTITYFNHYSMRRTFQRNRIALFY